MRTETEQDLLDALELYLALDAVKTVIPGRSTASMNGAGYAFLPAHQVALTRAQLAAEAYVAQARPPRLECDPFPKAPPTSPETPDTKRVSR